MTKAKRFSISVGGVLFTSKSKLIDYLRGVLNTQEINTKLDGCVFNIVDGVLRKHQNYNRKVGKGDYSLCVQVCKINPNNRHFCIIRADKTKVDFSFYEALSSSSHHTKVKQALRNEVRDQAYNYKKEYFNKNQDTRGFVVCPATLLKIRWEDSNLDHYPKQFEEIVQEWLVLNGLDIQTIKIKQHDTDPLMKCLSNSKLSLSFKEYHKVSAEYRVVLDKVNQQRARYKKGV